MHRLISIALILVASTPGLSSAQRMEAGIGWGPTSTGRMSGTGLYARLPVPTGLTIAGSEVEFTGFGTHGAADGSLFSCEQVEQFYCTGRQDSHTSLGVEVGTRIFWPGSGPHHGLYILLPGPSILRRMSKSVEHQAPTGLCFDGTDFISCPDNPPFQTFHRTTSYWAFGVTSGVGFAFGMASVNGFIEARLQTHWSTSVERRSNYFPLVVGVRF